MPTSTTDNHLTHLSTGSPSPSSDILQLQATADASTSTKPTITTSVYFKNSRPYVQKILKLRDPTEQKINDAGMTTKVLDDNEFLIFSISHL